MLRWTFVITVLFSAILVVPQFAGPAQSQVQTQTQPPASPEQVKPGTKAPTFVINLRGTDIRTLAEQVSDITGRTLVLAPSVTGTVTVVSSTPLDADGVWELFQSVLGGQGFTAMKFGDIWRIVPQADVKVGGSTMSDTAVPGRLDVITRLIKLKHFPATTAVGALRPLVASFGYIEAVADTNTLVITDTSENVRRIEQIARTLDEGNDQSITTIPLLHANAAEVGATVNGILASLGQGDTAGKVTVDARSNVLLLRADADTTQRIVNIVADLDVAGKPKPSVVPVTRVFRLKFADANAMVEILRGIVGSGQAPTNAVATALPVEQIQRADALATPRGPTDLAGKVLGSPAATAGGAAAEVAPPVVAAAPAAPVTNLANEDVTIEPVVAINAVVVRARAEVVANLGALIAQLDQRRPQVLIEAAIVEVSGDISEQLGVQLGFGSAAPPGGFAATSFAPSGPSLTNILGLLGVPSAVALSPSGLSIGLSRANQYGILIQALAQSTKANLLSTPSITTLDNQPAEIVVGQNVPFRTGSYSTVGGAAAPFTTIERKDVGITLRVVPRVNAGDVVQLDVSQEVSSLTNTTVAGAADLVTNTRSIKTTVLADNGGTIVLGGLITDDRQSTRSSVPGLDRLPLLGPLFRSKDENRTKRTLFVFLRPTILRNRADVGAVSTRQFQRLEAIQSDPSDTKSLLGANKNANKLPVEINGLY